MDVVEGIIKISLTLEEAYNIAWGISFYLESAITEHYNTFNQHDRESLFFSHKKKDIERMQLFFETSGHGSLYKHRIDDFKKLFEDMAKERTTTD